MGVWLALGILLQVFVYTLAGAGKAYIHMDEAFSLALAQYDKIDITANEDFYNTWHKKEYFQDYLAVQQKDLGNFEPVYENQKNDVHPPLYYMLLRGVMEVEALGGSEEFSKWPPIILNMVIMAGCTVLLYAVFREVIGQEKRGRYLALGLAVAAGLTVAGVSTVVYIRMYGLLTLMVLLTVWVALKMNREWREKRTVGWKWYVMLGIVAVLGTLTQYYYLFFLLGLAMMMVVKLVCEKEWRELVKYSGSLVGAGVMVLVLWPHIIQHMFFGYRGQGALANLVNLPVLGRQLWGYILIVDYNVFHRLGLGIVVAILGLVGYRKWRKMEAARFSEEFWIVFWPTVSYFSLAAIASPFRELRYIMPVCGLIFGLAIYVMGRLMSGVIKEGCREVVMFGVVSVVLLVVPAQLRLGWMRIELLYRDRQAVMTIVDKVPEAPILYFITTENNRFLDNILPFAAADESYLALDLVKPTVGEVKEILEGKNLSEGLIVFVSTSQEIEQTLEVVKEATGLRQVNFVQAVNTCNVYYLD